MITKEQAITADEFHYDDACKVTVGPRGGRKVSQEIWRRNGRTQIWKTRPTEFRVPIKLGLYTYAAITHHDLKRFHVTQDCPLQEQKDEVDMEHFDIMAVTHSG